MHFGHRGRDHLGLRQPDPGDVGSRGRRGHDGSAFFSDSNCTTFLGTVPSGGSVTQGSAFQPSNGTALAPAGAQSAQIGQNERTGANPGAFDFNEDEFFFQEAASVPTIPPVMLGLLGVTLAAYALLALRRARRSDALAR
jgi:hypothetical protein